MEMHIESGVFDNEHDPVFIIATEDLSFLHETMGRLQNYLEEVRLMIDNRESPSDSVNVKFQLLLKIQADWERLSEVVNRAQETTATNAGFAGFKKFLEKIEQDED